MENKDLQLRLEAMTKAQNTFQYAKDFGKSFLTQQELSDAKYAALAAIRLADEWLSYDFIHNVTEISEKQVALLIKLQSLEDEIQNL